MWISTAPTALAFSSQTIDDWCKLQDYADPYGNFFSGGPASGWYLVRDEPTATNTCYMYTWQKRVTENYANWYPTIPNAQYPGSPGLDSGNYRFSIHLPNTTRPTGKAVYYHYQFGTAQQSPTTIYTKVQSQFRGQTTNLNIPAALCEDANRPCGGYVRMIDYTSSTTPATIAADSFNYDRV